MRWGPLLRFLWLARPVRGRLAVAAAAGAAATGCAVALLATSGFLLARASQHPGIVAISMAVVAVRALSVGKGVLRYAERLAGHDVAFRVLARVRVKVYQRLERLAPAGLGALRSGDLLARLVSDVDGIQDLFIRGLTPAVAAAAAGAGTVAACLLVFAPAAGVLAAGLTVAGLVVPALAAARARSAARRTAPTRGTLAATLTDVVAGAADLTAFGGCDAALTRLAAADSDLTALARRSAGGEGLGAGLRTAVAGLTLCGVLVAGVAAVSAGSLTRVPLAVVSLAALASFEAVTDLPAAAVALGQARAGAARVGAVLDAPDPVRDPQAPLPAPAGPAVVSLRGARVRYHPAGPPALDGVDLDLVPGRAVALVGASGAGKSTVASVLLRFCDLSGGTATLGGVDLAAYRADDVRALIGGCPQDPHIFDATLRENLSLARPGARLCDLEEAAARARLLPWIRSLPRGWDTPAGPRGVAMSGGQRQRIALARAFLAAPPVMVLDEPTAHLGPADRRALTADLLEPARGQAVLFITHDLTGLEAADEIVVLAAGTVAERGTHPELLRLPGGCYRRMWECGPPGSGGPWDGPRPGR